MHLILLHVLLRRLQALLELNLFLLVQLVSETLVEVVSRNPDQRFGDESCCYVALEGEQGLRRGAGLNLKETVE